MYINNSTYSKPTLHKIINQSAYPLNTSNLLNNNTSNSIQLIGKPDSKIANNGILGNIRSLINKTDENLLNKIQSYAKPQTTQVSSVNIQDLKSVQETLLLIARPDVSKEKKVIAVTQLLNQLGQINFEGTVNQPITVEGQPVIGSTVTNTGKPGFVLASGEVVDQSSLVAAQNLNVALNTLLLLQGNTNSTHQILGITGQAILLANANNQISDSTAGHLNSVLGIANTISNWSEMSDAQRLGNISHISPLILNSARNLGVDISNTNIGNVSSVLGLATTAAGWENMSDEQRIAAATGTGNALVGTANSLGANIGTSTAGVALGTVGGVAGLVTGVKQAADVFDAIGDLPRSEAARFGAIGVGSAGAAIGASIATLGVATGAISGGAILGAQLGSAAMPVVGTVIGAAVGALAGFVVGKFGSGKSADQMMRDSWRKGLEQGGFAEKINGSHHVPLADGTTYNIGYDGRHKLTNVDGTQRQTFDVDWSNPLSGSAIPEAHIYALATGLDPSIEQGALWHRATAQALNAATSNASDSQMVTANFRAMLAKGQVDPLQLTLKIEVLRQENKISDQDYVIYINKINKLFNTQLQPVDRQTALAALQESTLV